MPSMRRTIRITRSHRACITRISGPRRNGAPLISSLIASKYLGYFERVLEQNPGGDRYLVGRRLSYCDLSLFQLVAGLRYAFPQAMTRLSSNFPRISNLHDRVVAQPRLPAYLKSPPRIAFSEQRIFRNYPELDAATPG